MGTSEGAVRVIGTISLVSSVLILCLCAFFYRRAAHFKKTAVEVQGTVVELRAGSGGGHEGTAYYPIVKFADRAGHEHTLYSRIGSYPPAYAVGEAAPVLYDPADPQRAKINSFIGLWFLPLIFGILGALDFLTGLFLLFALPGILRRFGLAQGSGNPAGQK